MGSKKSRSHRKKNPSTSTASSRGESSGTTGKAAASGDDAKKRTGRSTKSVQVEKRHVGCLPLSFEIAQD
jgi:hypothetical protein